MILGVDPGASTTGLAIVDEGKLAFHKTLPYEEAYARMDGLYSIYRFPVAVVEVNLAGVNYLRNPSGGIYRYNNRMGSAGANRVLGKRLAKKLRSLGIKVIESTPKCGCSKWSKGYWCTLFEWPEGKRLPSEHARDAAVLALLKERKIEYEKNIANRIMHAGGMREQDQQR